MKIIISTLWVPRSERPCRVARLKFSFSLEGLILAWQFQSRRDILIVFNLGDGRNIVSRALFRKRELRKNSVSCFRINSGVTDADLAKLNHQIIVRKLTTGYRRSFYNWNRGGLSAIQSVHLQHEELHTPNLGLGIYVKITLRHNLLQNKVSELNSALTSGNPVGSWNLWYNYTITLRQKLRQCVFWEFDCNYVTSKITS